jgi:PAS domain-containing protein
MIAESAQFFTALLTQESTYGLDVPPDQRRFTGIWTYNPQLVQESALITARMIGLPYQPPVQRDYARQSSFLAQIFANLMARRDEDTNRQVLLQHRDALLRSGLTSSETPMLLLDGQKHVLAASQSACQLLGAQNEVPVNQPLANVADGIFARHDPTSIEAPQVGLISTLDGRMLATHSRTLYNADGEEIGWVVSLHDAAPVPLSDQ